MRIIETDNFNGDYPDEKFVNLPNTLSTEHAQKIADAINNAFHENYPRFWRVVDNNYVLQPGFQP